MICVPARRWLLASSAAVLTTVLSVSISAQEYNPQRAHFNYQMFCQGCHAPDGAGSKVVPTLKNHVGHFLKSSEGREYLVRVPGSATSALSDEHLAEVLNYILRNFAGDSLAQSFTPFRENEVARLRQQPLNEVVNYRAQLLKRIETLNNTRDPIR